MLHWFCLKEPRKLGGVTTLHTPHAPTKLGRYRKSWAPVAGQFWILIRPTLQLPEKPSLELWYLLRHKSLCSQLAYDAKQCLICVPHSEYRQFLLPTNCEISKMWSQFKWLCQRAYHGTPIHNWPFSAVELKNCYFREMNLPHFKDMTSVENKNVKGKQFHVAGKHLDKYEGFQSCQTVLKMPTLPSLSRYLTFSNTRIE